MCLVRSLHSSEKHTELYWKYTEVLSYICKHITEIHRASLLRYTDQVYWDIQARYTEIYRGSLLRYTEQFYWVMVFIPRWSCSQFCYKVSRHHPRPATATAPGHIGNNTKLLNYSGISEIKTPGPLDQVPTLKLFSHWNKLIRKLFWSQWWHPY